MPRLYKILAFVLLFQYIFVFLPSHSVSQESFESWLLTYKEFALKKGVSQRTIETAFKNVKFLEQVIRYDRKQPEFYEDTITYVSKRANTSRVKIAKKLFKENIILFNEVENKFSVEKGSL